MSISPHAYGQTLLEKGGSRELLTEIRKVDEECRDSGVLPIYTLGHLAFLSGVPYQRLRDFILNTEAHYTELRMKKKNGSGFRTIRMPSDQLKRVQRYILRKCIPAQPSNDVAFAYRKGVGIREAAARHIGSRTLIKLDYSDFFTSIDSITVYEAFVRLGYPELLAFEMSMLCTWGGAVELANKTKRRPYILSGSRFLAQGAPTSGALSNLALAELDGYLRRLAYSGFRVTRYADDIAISSTDAMSREDCLAVIRDVAEQSTKYQLRLNPAKTRILLRKNSFRILGLAVTDVGVGLSRPYKRSFQKEIYGVRRDGLSGYAAYKGYGNAIEMAAYLWGHVAFGKGIDAEWGQRMGAELRTLRVPYIDVVGVFDRLGRDDRQSVPAEQSPSTGTIKR